MFFLSSGPCAHVLSKGYWNVASLATRSLLQSARLGVSVTKGNTPSTRNTWTSFMKIWKVAFEEFCVRWV